MQIIFLLQNQMQNKYNRYIINKQQEKNTSANKVIYIVQNPEFLLYDLWILKVSHPWNAH